MFSLIEDFFRTANRLFPIYHKDSFMKMVEWQYTQQTCDDAARWASINMIICLAYEFRFSNSLKPEKDREKARLYFKNAMSVFTELALRRTDLLSVQALLSMVCTSPLFSADWANLTICRHSSFAVIQALSLRFPSSRQPCGRVSGWGFTGIFHGQT